MAKIILLGASGSLGKHLLQQAVAAGHSVTALVRTPAKLPSELAGKIAVIQADLDTLSTEDLAAVVGGHDVMINSAGRVTDGPIFIRLVDKIVSAVESIPATGRPVCWFMAGAGLLDIDNAGRRGVDLPEVGTTYAPHRVNFERIRATGLDWRELCPGPMVEGPALGTNRLRISLDKLPVAIPAFVQHLPGALVLPFFAMRIPEMIIPYADAAAVILANLDADSAMSRHRIGLALPEGMRGKKNQWAKESGSAA